MAFSPIEIACIFVEAGESIRVSRWNTSGTCIQVGGGSLWAAYLLEVWSNFPCKYAWIQQFNSRCLMLLLVKSGLFWLSSKSNWVKVKVFELIQGTMCLEVFSDHFTSPCDETDWLLAFLVPITVFKSMVLNFVVLLMLPFHEFFFWKGFPFELYNVEFRNTSQSCLLSVVVSGILKWVALKSLVAINTWSIMISVQWVWIAGYMRVPSDAVIL